MPKNNDPIFWPDSSYDLSLRQSMQKNYSDSINILQIQWTQADINQRFVMGDQQIWAELFPNQANNRRKIFNFNIISPIIQAITGHQRQTRKQTIVIPTQKKGQKTADLLTKCLYYVEGNQFHHIYSDAFEQGALTNGVGFLYFYRDTTSSDIVSGEIKCRYIDMKACMFDPFFRKRSMEDARFFSTRTFYGREEAALMYHKFEDEIMNLPAGNYLDDKFYYMPEVYQLQFPNLMAVDEYWYASKREATYLIQKDTEECQEFRGDEEQLRDVMRMFPGVFSITKKYKPTVRRSIVINDRVIVDEAHPDGLDRYPLVPVLGYFQPDTPYYAYKFRSPVFDARDAQYLFNLRKVTDLDILQSQQQGLLVEQGALVTPDDALNNGNGRVLVRKKGTSPDSVTPMQIIPPSPVMIQMEEMLMEIVHRIVGVDPSAMGIDVDDKAGIISMMRQVATARNLQRLYDQFDEAQRLCGDIIVEMIQKNWTYGKILQVCGEEPTEEFDSKLFMQYNCKVVQGALTETQQQLELAQLLQSREILGDLLNPKFLLDRMTFQNKDEILKDVEEREKAAAEQAQQRAQLEMQQLQVDNETKVAYAADKKALAEEHYAKIQLDVAQAEEEINKSKLDQAQSLLEIAKAMKELQGLDINHLKEKIAILHEINNIDFDPNATEISRIQQKNSIKSNKQEVSV